MKRLILLFLFLQITLILTGCFDRKELEEQAYVISIGVDKTERDNIFRFTFEIANPEVGSSASNVSTKEPAQEVVSVLGTDFLSATSTANTSVAKEITLDQVRVVIVSEKLARSEQFIHVIQAAPSTVDLKLNAQLVISKEKAEDFIRHNKPRLESRPHKYFQYMLDRARETGVIPDAPLVRFFQITEGDADLFIAPLASTEREPTDKYGAEDDYKAGEIDINGGNPTQFIGSAVFKEGQMIDTLTGEENRYVLMLDTTLPQQDILATYKDPLQPEFDISAKVQIDGVKVKTDYKKHGKTVIDVSVNVHMNIFAIPSTEDYMLNPKKRRILYDSMQKQMYQKSVEVVRKSQEKFKGEPFYWSLHIRSKFLTIKEYEEADWSNKIFPNADVRLHIDVESIEFGKTLRQSNIGKVRD